MLPCQLLWLFSDSMLHANDERLNLNAPYLTLGKTHHDGRLVMWCDTGCSKLWNDPIWNKSATHAGAMWHAEASFTLAAAGQQGPSSMEPPKP